MKNILQLHHYDTIVVGGGAAGLAGAMVLARAHKKVLLIDNNKQSNLVSPESHAVFSRDKVKPRELYAIARQQLQYYPCVTIIDDTVNSATKENGFKLICRSGLNITGNTILLAQGVNYTIPDIPGAARIWGTKLWHCPYCDGYEAKGKKLIAIFEEDRMAHMRKLLSHWTNTVQFTVPSQINRIDDHENGITVVFNDNLTTVYDEGVIQVTPKPRDDIADQLGCKRKVSGHIDVDDFNMTTVDGVYAAGDQSSVLQQINTAVAAGHMAAATIVARS